MGKLSIISLNIFVLFVYKLFFGGDVNVSQNIPSYAKPGEKFIIEIEIEKGDREGFAKWQQKLPDGFVAKNLEMDGATFSFKNQEVKVIWMALPTSEKFSIKYEVETSTDLNNDFDLSGKFSYIEENERKEVVATTHNILISSEEPTNVVATAEPIEEETADSNELSEEEDINREEDVEMENEVITPEAENIVESGNEVLATNNQKSIVYQQDDIKITRKIQSFGNGKYRVDLSIEKNGYESFGKIEEYIPPGFTTNSIETQEGIFSFEKNVMKIMWMTLPEQETINVTYGMESTSNELDSAQIFGVFSYLKNDESVQIKLKDSEFRNTYTNIDKEELAEEGNTESEESLNSNTETTELTDTEEEAAKVNSPTDSEKLIENIANIPTAETDISYRVQIAAARKEVQQQYFIERHDISETVTIQFHEGWYKYTIGSFSVYKAARDKRNQIWGAENKINDAFVTAYNQGNRISVQEALMISKQKWYN